jgi:lipoprotein LprG
MTARRALLTLVLCGLLSAPVTTACSSGSSAETAPQLLARAKTTLDKTSSAHFLLTSQNAPTTGTLLTGGEGDIARPSSFQGTLKVLAAGATVDLKVVSVAGKVYAQLPFTTTYSTVDPKAFGFGDPGALLDPQTGISQLLKAATGAKLGSEKRIGGEAVREVSAQLPGALVQRILTSQDPAKPVAATFAVVSGSGQLRRAVLTGPFFSATTNATFTVELSKFGEHVTITAPPTG